MIITTKEFNNAVLFRCLDIDDSEIYATGAITKSGRQLLCKVDGPRGLSFPGRSIDDIAAQIFKMFRNIKTEKEIRKNMFSYSWNF